jgi:hypothetical protein
MEADPYIQDPTNSQSFNRYAYVMNNPLSAVDPSGYISWKKIRGAIKVVVGAVMAFYPYARWASYATIQSGMNDLNGQKSSNVGPAPTQVASFDSNGGNWNYTGPGSTYEQSASDRYYPYYGADTYDVVRASYRGRLTLSAASDDDYWNYLYSPPNDAIEPVYPLENMIGGFVGAVAKAGAAIAGTLIKTSARGVAKGASAYSVAFETTIPKLGLGTRPEHFKAANAALESTIKSDASVARMTEALGVQVPLNRGTSPANWSWHHVPDRPGVLQLVPRTQHQWGSLEQPLLHPGGKGGFSTWGADY